MSKLIEEWRPVVGYEGLYQVSDWGNVRSLDRLVLSKAGSYRKAYGVLLSQYIDKDGYCRVGLHFKRKQKIKGVHCLVAEAFIPNPDNKPQVDHINGVRNDNRVDNLRWFTLEENNSTDLAKSRKSKAAFKRSDNKKIVYQYTLDGEFVAKYNSTMEVERKNGYKRASIGRCCNKKQKTAYNYKWSYNEIN